MAEQVIILIPVFNDEAALNKLLEEMAISVRDLHDMKFKVLVVDDGSTGKLTIHSPGTLPIHLLRLQRNIGHQKAIAIGLAFIQANDACDKVLVMDSDGEDRPVDAISLLRHSLKEPDTIIFAARKSRQENAEFRLFYYLYKFAFKILTGKKIAFGNFLVVPRPLLDKVVHYSEIWNHIAGGILKTGLPYTSISTHRGKRYAGKSSMNFTKLLIHGLGAISVFIEIIASRLLIFSLLLIAISVIGIFVLLYIKAFTDLAVPGWTSTVASAMLIILLQSFLLSLFTIFLYLSSQSQRKFIPAHHYKDYTGEMEIIHK